MRFTSLLNQIVSLLYLVQIYYKKGAKNVFFVKVYHYEEERRARAFYWSYSYLN